MHETRDKFKKMDEPIVASGRRMAFWTVVLLATAGLVSAPGHSSPGKPAARSPRAVEDFARLPLRFEANQGQTDGRVKFLSQGEGFSLFLTDTEAVLSLRKPDGKDRAKTDVIRMRVGEGNSEVQPQGQALQPGLANYMLGEDPGRWQLGVPGFGRVRYAGVYPGVDLVYYGNQRRLEYDFEVAAGANPGLIRLHFEGAERIALDADKNLQIFGENGGVTFHKPEVYQVIDGKRRGVAGHFRLLKGNSVGFDLGAYDTARPLTIDPTLVYSTYLGGSTMDSINAIAVDSAGNTYLTGTTTSTNFPVTPGVVQSTDSDARSAVFVTKLNSSGSALIYSTFLGGTGGSSGGDFGQALAIDASGDAYVAGYTYSSDFPTTKGAFQTANQGGVNKGSTGFVTKLNPAGTALIYSTYLGGSVTDQIYGLAVDGAGDAYVAGNSYSANFPVTAGVVQTTNKSASTFGFNLFATKLNSTGTGLIYSTFLGGTDNYAGQNAVRIAIDSAGDAFVAGTSLAPDFPVTTGAFQTKNPAKAGHSDMTLSKLNPTATKLLYSTFLGGSGSNYGDDIPNALAVDSAGNAYLVGTTWETDYPVTKGALKTTSAATASSHSAGFVTKINPAGSALVYSTFLGGSGADRAVGLAIDSTGDAFLTGSANSTDFPVTSNAYQSTNLAAFNNGSVVFLSELNPGGSALLYSTYFGGNNSFGDSGNSLALGANGAVYLAGYTSAKDFPITSNAYDPNYSSQFSQLGFVSEFTFSTVLPTLPTGTLLTTTQNPSTVGTSLTFTASVTPTTGTGVPTGNVIFNIDQKNVATVTLNSLGYASYTASTLTNGQHAILASYLGSTKYSASGGNLVENITAATPIISPGTGIYHAAQLVTISDSTPNAVVYYTTDGTTPTTASTKYAGPLVVSSTTFLQAIAVLGNLANPNIAAAGYRFINAPTALAVASSSVGTVNATLNSLVNTYGASGSYYFLYGTSATALTKSTPVTPLTVSHGGTGITFVPVAVSARITGLTTKTTYYFQVVVTTTAGSSSGSVLSFTTN